MKKPEMAAFLARKTGISQQKAAEALDQLFQEMAKALAANGRLRISGFGVFRLFTQKNRTYRHPATGELITKVQKRIGFRPLRFVKDRM